MPHWTRVRDKDTKHEYDVEASVYDEALHTKVNAPAQYPDLIGEGERPRPMKPYLTKAGQPATPEKETSR